MSTSDGAVVVIGAGQAGHQVASSLRLRGYPSAVVLVGDENGLPYQRPPLSKEFLLDSEGRVEVELADENHYVENGIELKLGHPAVSVDRSSRTVVLRSGARLSYEHLVLATGVRPRRLAIAGQDLRNVHTLSTRADAAAVRRRLGSSRNAVVIGGGFIGLEFATVANQLGLHVTVLEAADVVMKRAVSTSVANFLTGRHRRNGIDVRTSASVVELIGEDGKVSAVELISGERIAADLVVLGVGVEPNTELAADTGLAVDNGIVVDEYLRTEDSAVFAIGDCAHYPSAYADGSVRLESVQNAIDQARSVAATLTGSPEPYRAVPWFWSLQAGHKLQIAGLSTGYDSTVVRESAEDGKFSVFCYRDTRLVAVESLSRPADHMAARRLLAAGSSVSPAQAADPSFDLKKHSLRPATELSDRGRSNGP
jgi:3-phenylpropionate/trans-cinnamate dioxygenase ferredoxin reductase component